MTRIPFHWSPALQQRLQRLRRPAWLGTLRRTSPLSDHWGFDRGTPIDRYYIEEFLACHRSDIRGRVLEAKDTRYVDRFGTAVDQCDVLDLDPANVRATIVADLSAADAIPSDRYDCIVLTQVLQFVYDFRRAVVHSHRILRRDGVILATVPGISKVGPLSEGPPEYWRFTPAACRRLFEEVFGVGRVSVSAAGNALAAIAFLTGLAREELSPSELAVTDEFFPVTIAIRAVK